MSGSGEVISEDANPCSIDLSLYIYTDGLK